MKISELARHTGASIRSLRYYETKQLLSPDRQQNGYRSYNKTSIERVRDIQFYLHLGLTADQIFQIVWCGRPDNVLSPFDHTRHSCCPETINLYMNKLTEIEEQITALEKARTYLRQRLACSISKESIDELFLM